MTRKTRREFLGSAIGASPLLIGSTRAAKDRKGTKVGGQCQEQLDECKRENEELHRLIEEQKHEIHKLKEQIEHLRDQKYQYDSDTRKKALEVGKELRDAVVMIQPYFGGGRATGTGWFVDDHHIITNQHVVSGLINDRTEETYVWTANQENIDVTLVDYKDTPDVALLETSATAPNTLPLGSQDSLSKGQPLVRVGHPSGIEQWLIALGEARTQELRGGWAFEAEIPSKGGTSGSPAATLDGEIVGMSWAGSSVQPFRPVDEPPGVGPTKVYEEYPIQKYNRTLHISIDRIQELVSEWKS